MKKSPGKFVIWTAALVLGVVLGVVCTKFSLNGLKAFFDFVASAYTRLFQFVAIPTVALAILTAMASLGTTGNGGRIFRKTFGYTLLTSFLAALLGMVLYIIVKPGNVAKEVIEKGADVKMVTDLSAKADTVYGHILNALPNNLVNPFSNGNVLPVVLIAASIGLAIAYLMKRGNENVATLYKAVQGLQEVFFSLIKALIWALPVGIVAFAAQLACQVSDDFGIDSIGKYVFVVLAGNLIQFFIVLPLFCFCRGVNGYRVMKQMTPALMMALFTKSSAATLPVTVSTAESNMKARPEVARFILPLCCTINMNGCAAFILVTSLFVMQNGGLALTIPTMLLWCVIAVFCAIGNAGVPMGCYFLTLSLMAGIGDMPLGILGVILPIYTIIDMIETAENVWSDCCICSVVNKELP